jgi:uncharacterized membrane protein
MQAKARALGHPIHQMLIVFPLGLLSTSFIYDLFYLGMKKPDFAIVSFWMMIAGIAGAAAAAAFGFIDWLAIPDNTRAKRIGLWHGSGNTVVLILFLISAFLRQGSGHVPPGGAVFLSLIGVLLALVTGWMGGELVDRLSVGVDEGANLNSVSSLSHRPATEQETERESVLR